MVGFLEGLEQVWTANIEAGTRYYDDLFKPSPIPKVPITSTISIVAIAVGLGALVFLFKK